jgi:hypothetical protein
MATKSEALATQFETKVREAAATIETLSDGDWKKVTAAEKWPVGVTAHHLAGSFEPVAGIVTAIASGKPMGGFSMADLDEMNARHAREHAGCTKAETLTLLSRGAATAAATIRSLSDEQLSRRVTVLTDAPPMSAEDMINGALIHHVDEHLGSIRRTVA